jgi:hypothetical protein
MVGWAEAAGPRSLSLETKNNLCFGGVTSHTDKTSRTLESGFGLVKGFYEA